MPTSERSRSAVCPFFLSAVGKPGNCWASSVGCEGVTERSKITIRFVGFDDYTQYRKAHCDGKFSDCPVYIGLSAKYDGGESDDGF